MSNKNENQISAAAPAPQASPASNPKDKATNPSTKEPNVPDQDKGKNAEPKQGAGDRK